MIGRNGIFNGLWSDVISHDYYHDADRRVHSVHNRIVATAADFKHYCRMSNATMLTTAGGYTDVLVLDSERSDCGARPAEGATFTPNVFSPVMPKVEESGGREGDRGDPLDITNGNLVCKVMCTPSMILQHYRFSPSSWY